MSKTDGNSDLSSWKWFEFTFHFEFISGQFVMECSSSAKSFAIPNSKFTRDQMEYATFNSHFWLMMENIRSFFPFCSLALSACHQIIIFSSHECAMVALRVMTLPLIYLIYLFKFFYSLSSLSFVNDLCFFSGRKCLRSPSVQNSWKISTKTPNFLKLSIKMFSHYFSICYGYAKHYLNFSESKCVCASAYRS